MIKKKYTNTKNNKQKTKIKNLLELKSNWGILNTNINYNV